MVCEVFIVVVSTQKFRKILERRGGACVYEILDFYKTVKRGQYVQRGKSW